jgi:hypothetical protein
MTKIWKTAVFTAAVVVTSVFASPSSAEIVFDSFAGLGFQGATIGNYRLSNALALAGTSRTMTQFSAWVAAGSNSTFTFQFYRPDGPGGSPGSLIWESPVQTFSYTAPLINDKVFTINVPNVEIPNSFIYTVNTLTGTNNGLIRTGPPTVGAVNGVWEYQQATSTWNQTNDSSFGARVTAVPESVSPALVSLASAIALVWWRSSR